MKHPNKSIRTTAEKLHGYMCRTNHTDGCDWTYGSWEEHPRYAHDEFYAKAKVLHSIYENNEAAIEQFLVAYLAIRR